MGWDFLKTSVKKGERCREIDIWRLQALLNNFRRILFLNNSILEEMALLERTLGGEFIFDSAFLEKSVRTLSSRVHHVAYNLNALTGNAYIPLYDAYQELRIILDDILAGDTRALCPVPVLPLDEIGWELEQLVGIDLVCLAELQHLSGLSAVDGFVLTSEGSSALLPEGLIVPQVQDELFSDEEDLAEKGLGFTADVVRKGITEQLDLIFQEQGPVRLRVIMTNIERELKPMRTVARFFLEPDIQNRRLRVVSSMVSGQESSVLATIWMDAGKTDTTESWTDLFAQGIERIYAMLDQPQADMKAINPQDAIALFVRPAPIPNCNGIVTTREKDLLDDTLVITASSPQAPELLDRFVLRHTYPFDLLRSTIHTKSPLHRFADGRLATDLDDSNPQRSAGRGSALLTSTELKSLAETAMVLERLLGMNLEMYWQLTGERELQITRIRPKPAQKEEQESLPDINATEPDAPILCEGGEMVQAGVGAGKIVHVTDLSATQDFPAGAIAVARIASPSLTPVLQKAAAVITEYGSATGHLATVARELRTPAIFGLHRALELLPEGTEATLLASEATVYAGILDLKCRRSMEEHNFSPYDHEYRTLRRLLRFILPLNLIDPDAERFSPGGCRSYHDVIHFCHEKAVDELAHFQERRPGLGTIRTTRMDLGVPMDIRILDIGGGLQAKHSDPPRAEDVLSFPFGAFLTGLLNKDAWKSNLPSLKFRDIVSSVPHSMGILNNSDQTLPANLAIIGDDYINISLRLGYHFSVIDAHLGSDVARNYVYFRFAGGLADPERRARRARFIRNVLAAMDFVVSVKGDLVIARIKAEPPPILEDAIRVLGALTAFSRQRDTAMEREEDVDALFADFSALFLEDFKAVVARIFGRHEGGSGL